MINVKYQRMTSRWQFNNRKVGKETRQSTSDEELLYLLGICQWVFNSNCGFIIEMIDKEHHDNSNKPWHTLIELTAGQLKDYENKITEIMGDDIYNLFDKLVTKRNSIIHSLPTGEKVDDYVIPIYRNDSKGINIKIDKEYLREFINEELSDLIYKFRGY